MPRLSNFFVPLMASVMRIFGRNDRIERYWRLAVAQDGVAELLLYGVIGQMAWNDEPSLEAQALVREIGQINASTIRVRISSPGGLIADGVAIFNALQRHPAMIETYNDAEASSIASYLFMAGDRRVMAGNAMLMIHSAWAFVGGNPAQLRKYAEVLDRTNQALIPAYARSGMSEDEVNALLADGEDHWYLANEALDAGIATEVDEALASAALHDFSTHQPPTQLLAQRPAPAQPRIEPTGALGPADPPVPGTDAPANPSEVKPMNWILVARVLALSLAASVTEAQAKAAVIEHLGLAVDATDDTIGAAIAARQAATPGAEASAASVSHANLDDAISAAMARDDQRRVAISGMFARYNTRNIPGLRDLETRCLNNRTVSPESASLQLLSLLGEQAEPLAAHHVVMGEDSIERQRNGMTQALLARMGVRDEQYDPQNPWRGHSLLDLGRDCLAVQGRSVRSMDRLELADLLVIRPTAANTTSDFPNVISNTLHRLVLNGFMEVQNTWQFVCRQGDVSDFRDWERHVPGIIGNFEEVNEHGEYRNKNIPDTEKNSIRARRRGLILEVTTEVLVNDDIGYIQSQAMDIGRSGSRTIDAKFYELLNSNPVLTSDGKAVFHTDHNNLAASGAAPTVDLIDAAAVSMAQQTAPAAAGETTGQLLDIAPDVILANRVRQGNLRVLIGAEYDPDTANKLQKPNKVRNLVSNVVTSARASAAPWYLFANPSIAPVFEVVFLNGQREPRVVMEENFRTSGLAWKGELPFGVGAIDFRGAFKNPGA